MFSVIRPSFDVVKEGRILYNPKDITRLNLVASRTSSGDDQEDDRIKMNMLPETLKTTKMGRSFLSFFLVTTSI